MKVHSIDFSIAPLLGEKCVCCNEKIKCTKYYIMKSNKRKWICPECVVVEAI